MLGVGSVDGVVEKSNDDVVVAVVANGVDVDAVDAVAVVMVEDMKRLLWFWRKFGVGSLKASGSDVNEDENSNLNESTI